MAVSGQLHAPAALIPKEDPDMYRIEGWVDPRPGAETVARTGDHFPAPTGNLTAAFQPAAQSLQ
jgi:hypothetical protein